MSYAYAILLVVFLVIAILLVVFILAQQGKGASMGASFGAGASNTLFGSAGSGNFFTKLTWILTALFFSISLILGVMNHHRDTQEGKFDNIATENSEKVKESRIVKTDSSEAAKGENAPKAIVVKDQSVPANKKPTTSANDVKTNTDKAVQPEVNNKAMPVKPSANTPSTDKKVDAVKTDSTGNANKATEKN